MFDIYIKFDFLMLESDDEPEVRVPGLKEFKATARKAGPKAADVVVTRLDAADSPAEAVDTPPRILKASGQSFSYIVRLLKVKVKLLDMSVAALGLGRSCARTINLLL